MLPQHDSVTKAVDAVAAGAIVSTLLGYLPSVAAVLGIVWYILQIYGWFEKRCNKKKNFKRRAIDKE